MTSFVVTEDHRRRARAFAAFIGMHPATNMPWTDAQIETLATDIAADDYAVAQRHWSLTSVPTNDD
jgi:hypothetical protein